MVGRKRGFSLFWDHDVHLDILYIGTSFVCVKTTWCFQNESMIICFAYVPPYYKDKLRTWQDIKNYTEQLTNP